MFYNATAQETGRYSLIAKGENGNLFPDDVSLCDSTYALTFIEGLETCDIKKGTTIEFGYGKAKEYWISSSDHTLNEDGTYKKLGSFLNSIFNIYAKKDSKNNITFKLELINDSSKYKEYSLFTKKTTTVDDLDTITPGDKLNLRNSTVPRYQSLLMI